MVGVDKIERGLAAWLDAELLPMMGQGTAGRVLAGAAGGILCKRMGNAIKALSGNRAATMLGLVDEQGGVDIEIMRDEIGKQMPESGLPIQLPLIGTVTLYRKDINNLYDYIMRG